MSKHAKSLIVWFPGRLSAGMLLFCHFGLFSGDHGVTMATKTIIYKRMLQT